MTGLRPRKPAGSSVVGKLKRPVKVQFLVSRILLNEYRARNMDTGRVEYFS
jgi:hypothetical protein